MTSVMIVGAGVAGSTLAATLQRPEWKLEMFDDRLEPPDVGTAFGLWPNAMSRLNSIGIGVRVRAHGVHVCDGAIRYRVGRVLIRLTGQDIWLVTRPVLLSLLREAVAPSVTTRHQHVGNGILMDGDLVVGADGIDSVVRRDRWGAGSAARRARVTTLRGMVHQDLGLTGLDEYWGRAAQFGMTPNPGETTNWFCTMPERRFVSTRAALDYARHLYSDFAPVVRRVLDAADPSQTLIQGVGVSRTLIRLHKRNAVLIGDAAHAMAPNLGRGACESIVDAVVLGELLNRYEPREALVRYRRQRLVPPQLIRMAATALMRLSLADRFAPTRDTTLRAIQRVAAR